MLRYRYAISLGGRLASMPPFNETRWDYRKLSQDEFIIRSTNMHGNLYDYTLSKYIGINEPISIICNKHGEFKQTPAKHFRGHGCPKCANSGASNKSVKWLESISAKEQIYIQHAENDGEFRIPNTRFKVDGFCKETNTVYEFHGNCWHGNPCLYEPTDTPHPFNNKTAKELYDATIDREYRIKELGYNLIVMWENNYSVIA